MINRRLFLASTASIPLAACAGVTIDQAMVTVSADVSTIAAGLKGVLTQLGGLSIAGLTPAVVATVGNAIGDIQSVATSIAGITSTATAQPLIQKLESYLNTVVTALAVLPLPPPISTALQAASILLPIIETAVGLLVPSTAAGARVALPAMSADQARLILKGAAVGAR